MILALLMMVQGPVRVLADSPDYISEVKIAMGDSAEDDLAGYIILKDADGKVVDLNKDAGGGWGSQGDKRVLLGYKTTKNQSEAITDLAVMNMKGGYDVKAYDLLIEQRMNSQVIPFIEKFLTTINEYRENIDSDDEVNRARAEYVRAALNKFTDDDCGGAGLGDLLLNETKFEMGDAAYNKLSEAEKNKHCDIVTLFLQADGQLMLMIYSLLTKGADTLESSWMERFAGTTYDDVLSWYELPDSEAEEQAARDYEDDARILLQNWDAFRDTLLGVDEAEAALADLDLPDYEKITDTIEKLDENSSEKEVENALDEMLEAQIQEDKVLVNAVTISLVDYLENIEYEDGTMYDFFTQDSSYVGENIEILYPLVACLTEGQRAGLEFLSLQEMVMLSNRDTEYSPDDLKEMEEVSVFEGIDRQIYQTGGVALTSDALRTKALEIEKNLADESGITGKTIALWCVTGVAALGWLASIGNLGYRISDLLPKKNQLNIFIEKKEGWIEYKATKSFWGKEIDVIDKNIEEYAQKIEDQTKLVDAAAASTKTAAWMSAGFTAAVAILSGVSAYMTWQDLKNHYKVDYTPIPVYMVEEESITYYGKDNTKMVKENHAAYYKVVPCNRPTDSKWYSVMGEGSERRRRPAVAGALCLQGQQGDASDPGRFAGRGGRQQ